MPKDTKTRYQGVFARHKSGCAKEHGKRCSCSPAYWGKVWDRDVQRSRITAFLPTPAAARNAREDLLRDVRNGMLPADESMRVHTPPSRRSCGGHELGVALNKHGRRYKPRPYGIWRAR